MKPYYETKLGKLYHCDFLDNELPDKCANLIISDPPYFKVKGEFDFKWKTFDDYLNDVELWAKECKRLLADNGTLFWWGNSKKIAYSQIIIDKYFHLENSMIWRKTDSIQYQYYSVDLSRCFNTHNERLLMYSNDYEPSDWNKTGAERIHEEFLKPQNPFSIYLKDEFKKAGVSRIEIAALFPSKTGNTTGCVSNWLNGDNVIMEGQYLKIRKYLNGEYLRKEYEDLRKEYEDLRKEYEDLRKEYEDLRKEYESQRRYFNNELKLEEVLNFSQDSKTSKRYDHDTVKSESLTRSLILTCSKKEDFVIIPFAGSGTECHMAVEEGRIFSAYEIKEKYCSIIAKRIEKENQQLRLF
jgi:site-specific DNA-methyltransferase (adenine-specific)